MQRAAGLTPAVMHLLVPSPAKYSAKGERGYGNKGES